MYLPGSIQFGYSEPTPLNNQLGDEFLYRPLCLRALEAGTVRLIVKSHQHQGSSRAPMAHCRGVAALGQRHSCGRRRRQHECPAMRGNLRSGERRLRVVGMWRYGSTQPHSSENRHVRHAGHSVLRVTCTASTRSHILRSHTNASQTSKGADQTRRCKPTRHNESKCFFASFFCAGKTNFLHSTNPTK